MVERADGIHKLPESQGRADFNQLRLQIEVGDAFGGRSQSNQEQVAQQIVKETDLELELSFLPGGGERFGDLQSLVIREGAGAGLDCVHQFPAGLPVLLQVQIQGPSEAAPGDPSHQR